jgi:3-hydroxyacyl-CoA dehydrogenase
LADSGRLGVKSGRGLYLYDGRRQLDPDPAIYAVLGLTPTVRDPDLAALAERMVLPMVNEAARCLAEGIVAGPQELDLAMILGTGFPPFRGGLCRWADDVGLSRIGDKLERLAAGGERFRPSPSLLQTAAVGGFYASSQAATAS